jgi:chromosome condensin MukBEF ATPase and DNA-binding subunit MukB
MAEENERLNTWHTTLSEAWKARAEKGEFRVKELEAEVEEHENARSLLTELCQREKTRAEKGEAELKKVKAELKVRVGQLENGYDELKGLTGKWKARAEKSEAELARWKPLIEAAMAPVPPDEKRYAGTRIGKAVWEQSILRAALKCREEKP